MRKKRKRLIKKVRKVPTVFLLLIIVGFISVVVYLMRQSESFTRFISTEKMGTPHVTDKNSHNVGSNDNDNKSSYNNNGTSHNNGTYNNASEKSALPKVSLFVPNWNLSGLGNLFAPNITQSGLEYIMYFGIAPDENGINTSENGYKRLDAFSQALSSSQIRTLLTIRMMNEDVNNTIFENNDLQGKIIRESLALTKNNGFSGIVLDLEHSALATEKNTEYITRFVKAFCTSAHKEDLLCTMAVYGDVFYRMRPYDIEKLDTNVDRFYIMAYDFHKSYGQPGPNFPLQKGNKYGYDLEIMIDQFLEKTTAEKVSVVFGMYGYDWKVDEQNRPIISGKPVTLNQAKKLYLNGCDFAQCSVKRDSISREMSVEYHDNEGKKHLVWLEDESSVNSKIDLLQSKNVSHIGFWAWGYY